MKAILLLLLAVAPVALFVACNGDDAGSATPGVGVTAEATVTSGPQDQTPPPAESPVVTPTSEPEVCLPNPDPATSDFQVISQPSAGDSVASPVTISGQVLAFEATYQIGIFDSAGDPIVETFGMAEATEIGQLAPFSIDVAFAVDEPTPACIWVYEQSARDGSPIHVGQIPVVLSP